MDPKDYTPELTKRYLDWKQAERFRDQAQQQAQQAQQTVIAAAGEAALKEVRFKSAAELLYGVDTAYTYNEQDGLVFMSKDKAPK